MLLYHSCNIPFATARLLPSIPTLPPMPCVHIPPAYYSFPPPFGGWCDGDRWQRQWRRRRGGVTMISSCFCWWRQPIIMWQLERRKGENEMGKKRRKGDGKNNDMQLALKTCHCRHLPPSHPLPPSTTMKYSLRQTAAPGAQRCMCAAPRRQGHKARDTYIQHFLLDGDTIYAAQHYASLSPLPPSLSLLPPCLPP